MPGLFLFRIAINQFILGVGLFLITCNRTVHTLASSFLFTIIIYHCITSELHSNNVPRHPNRGRERPIFLILSNFCWTSIFSQGRTNYPKISCYVVNHFCSSIKGPGCPTQELFNDHLLALVVFCVSPEINEPPSRVVEMVLVSR